MNQRMRSCGWLARPATQAAGRLGAGAALLSLLLFTPQALPAAEPFLEKTNLFTEATDGFRLYRIPGISDLAVLPDGTVLCFYESGDPESPRKNGRPWAYSFLTLARFNLEWLTSGHAPPRPSSG